MKKTAVVFYENNARVFINPLPETLEGQPHIFIETKDFVDMEHVPTQYWKNDSGKLVEMSAEEKIRRNNKLNMWAFKRDGVHELHKQHTSHLVSEYASHITSVDDVNDRLDDFRADVGFDMKALVQMNDDTSSMCLKATEEAFSSAEEEIQALKLDTAALVAGIKEDAMKAISIVDATLDAVDACHQEQYNDAASWLTVLEMKSHRQSIAMRHITKNIAIDKLILVSHWCWLLVITYLILRK